MRKSLLTFGFGLLGLAIYWISSVEAAQTNSEMAAKAAKETNHRDFALPKGIQLTTEQKTALDEIKQKQIPKVAQLSSQLGELLTKEQKTARKAAIAQARMDGLKGRARATAIDRAVNLTDDQKKQFDKIKPELSKLRLEIKQQIYGLLTDEQRTHYRLPKARDASTFHEPKITMPDS